jgi:hypothetical protein
VVLHASPAQNRPEQQSESTSHISGTWPHSSALDPEDPLLLPPVEKPPLLLPVENPPLFPPAENPWLVLPLEKPVPVPLPDLPAQP